MSLRTKVLVLSVLAALLLVSFGCASAPKAPEKVPVPADTMIIDSRPKRPKFDKGYIPSAVSIPDSKFDEMKGSLPENKEALLIFYCQGPT